jgi:hypothetical protein
MSRFELDMWASAYKIVCNPAITANCSVDQNPL